MGGTLPDARGGVLLRGCLVPYRTGPRPCRRIPSLCRPSPPPSSRALLLPRSLQRLPWSCAAPAGLPPAGDPPGPPGTDPARPHRKPGADPSRQPRGSGCRPLIGSPGVQAAGPLRQPRGWAAGTALSTLSRHSSLDRETTGPRRTWLPSRSSPLRRRSPPREASRVAKPLLGGRAGGSRPLARKI